MTKKELAVAPETVVWEELKAVASAIGERHPTLAMAIFSAIGAECIGPDEAARLRHHLAVFAQESPRARWLASQRRDWRAEFRVPKGSVVQEFKLR